MKIALAGCGNVGSSLLHHLLTLPDLEHVAVFDTITVRARAALLDVASHLPDRARLVSIEDREALGEADLVVITAGYKTSADYSRADERRENRLIIGEILSGIYLKKTALVIAIPGPVEYIAAIVQQSTGLSHRQVIGFGGDLDRNRLAYLMERKGIDIHHAHVIGEHGQRAIPVLEDESEYDQLADGVRTYLGRIAFLSGDKRNLATAPLLAGLIEDVMQDTKTLHTVAGYHPKYQVLLNMAVHDRTRRDLGFRTNPHQRSREVPICSICWWIGGQGCTNNWIGL